MNVKDNTLICILIGQQIFFHALLFPIPIPGVRLLSEVVLSFFVFRIGYRKTFVLTSFSTTFELIRGFQGYMFLWLRSLNIVRNVVPLIPNISALIIAIKIWLWFCALFIIPITLFILSFVSVIGLAFVLRRFNFYRRIQGASMK